MAERRREPSGAEKTLIRIAELRQEVFKYISILPMIIIATGERIRWC
jgi:hypothetical protein